MCQFILQVDFNNKFIKHSRKTIYVAILNILIYLCLLIFLVFLFTVNFFSIKLSWPHNLWWYSINIWSEPGAEQEKKIRGGKGGAFPCSMLLLLNIYKGGVFPCSGRGPCQPPLPPPLVWTYLVSKSWISRVNLAFSRAIIYLFICCCCYFIFLLYCQIN